MNYHPQHLWNVTPKEAIKIQSGLAKLIVLEKGFDEIKRVAGVDTSYHLARKTVYSGVIIYSFPDLKVLEERYATKKIEFAYIPGLLTFREGPAVLAAFEKVKKTPDLIIFDGQGIAHPRRLGLATHLGIILNRPSLGCAKSRLVGTYEEPPNEVGAYSWLRVNGEAVGAVVRTKKDVKPIFVSPGFKIDLITSIEIALRCTRGYRVPEPTRSAHIFIERIKRKLAG